MAWTDGALGRLSTRKDGSGGICLFVYLKLYIRRLQFMSPRKAVGEMTVEALRFFVEDAEEG